MNELTLVRLSAGDVERILDLEHRVCIPPLQVKRETLLHRFKVGNIMLGLQKSPDDPTLVSTVAFRFSIFYPEHPEHFPSKFADFSTPPIVPPVCNAAFVYSFNVDPALRKGGYGFRICAHILHPAFGIIEGTGCKYIIADGRPTSYNGSTGYPQEQCSVIPEFKAAIDAHLAGGPFPPEETLFLEPTWRVYRHFVPSFKPLWILRDFFPQDVPAGGLRVILCAEI